MSTSRMSLTKQINKVIGNRITLFLIASMVIIFGLTIYDSTVSVRQLRSRINEQIKPIEDFVIDQSLINNLETIELKIESFNERNPSFHLRWVRQGAPIYNKITWHFPLSWIYDYHIGEISGYKFGYFNVVGNFLSDTTLIYDLFIRLSLFLIFILSIFIILRPLVYKIPEQLFINPINRFIDLISNNKVRSDNEQQIVPIELELLEIKILGLLKTAKEHEKNKAEIELGQIAARLAHDLHSPLAAMEIGLELLTKKVPKDDLSILTKGMQCVRDISNNILDQYRNNGAITSPNEKPIYDNGNIARPILLFSLSEVVLSQKRYEWNQNPCELVLTIHSGAKIGWIAASPNEITRLLSNLLNNAYDALLIKNTGCIYVSLSKIENELHLQIEDNGSGIPAEKIIDVLNGQSLKHLGKGLGLSSAKEYMDKIGGKLAISSTVNIGTKINLVFPCIHSLPWFPKHILLNGANIVVILDDDHSMLLHWQNRISQAGFLPKLFSTYENALQWTINNSELLSSAIFLADYKLEDNKTNGLTFLNTIKNNNNRYLITSHAEQLHIQNAAEEAGIWLIPKSLVNEISLDVIPVTVS